MLGPDDYRDMAEEARQNILQCESLLKGCPEDKRSEYEKKLRISQRQYSESLKELERFGLQPA